jgi:L-ribulokinase
MQIYADVLGKPITLAESNQSVALGAAILGVLAVDSSGKPDAAKVIRAMARQRKSPVYKPNAKRAKAYAALYAQYRALANGAPIRDVMHALESQRTSPKPGK